MIDDVDEPAGQPGLVGEPDAERDVADLRDATNRRACASGWSRTPRSSEATNIAATESAMMISATGRALKVDGDAEDREVEADQQIDRDLGRGRREEGGRPRRRVGVGVRQPDMEREQSELQADADGHEGQRRHDRRANCSAQAGPRRAAISTMLRLPVTR